jgi:hypothetical protein
MTVIESSCHCGQVRIEIARAPETVTDCNCSICRRYATLWAYYSPSDVRIAGETTFYTWGDKDIEFHRCTNCGCVTHWAPAGGKSRDRMGVNTRLMAPEVLAQARVRRLDGAVTWKYLDE